MGEKLFLVNFYVDWDMYVLQMSKGGISIFKSLEKG